MKFCSDYIKIQLNIKGYILMVKFKKGRGFKFNYV